MNYRNYKTQKVDYRNNIIDKSKRFNRKIIILIKLIRILRNELNNIKNSLKIMNKLQNNKRIQYQNFRAK